MKNMHITLGEEWVARLDGLSERLDQSRISLVREAVVEYVVRREREVLEEEMGRYAQEMGEASSELTEWSASEVDRMLREHTEW